MFDPEVFKPMVRDVARSVSNNFPPYVTAEDTEQTLYVWIYENRNTVQKITEDGPGWEPKIARLMRKAAFGYCAKEKASIEGYDTADLFKYSLPKLQALLPDVFDYDSWQSFGQHGDGQPSSKPQANQTGDRLAELVDIKIAINRLKGETATLLYLQYACLYTSEMLADHFGITAEAAKKRSQRALTALRKQLGYKPANEAPGVAERRTVLSNAAARAALTNGYEG